MQLLDFTIYYHKTLHPSSIPWNSLCLSGFQRVNGTIPPFITLHHPSFSMVSSSALTPRIAQPGPVKKGQKQAFLEVKEDLS